MPTVVPVHQLLAGRDVSPQVKKDCLAQGLNLNLLTYIKYLVANGKIAG
jgi:hypothetical protein